MTELTNPNTWNDFPKPPAGPTVVRGTVRVGTLEGWTDLGFLTDDGLTFATDGTIRPTVAGDAGAAPVVRYSAEADAELERGAYDDMVRRLIGTTPTPQQRAVAQAVTQANGGLGVYQGRRGPTSHFYVSPNQAAALGVEMRTDAEWAARRLAAVTPVTHADPLPAPGVPDPLPELSPITLPTYWRERIIAEAMYAAGHQDETEEYEPDDAGSWHDKVSRALAAMLGEPEETELDEATRERLDDAFGHLKRSNSWCSVSDRAYRAAVPPQSKPAPEPEAQPEETASEEMIVHYERGDYRVVEARRAGFPTTFIVQRRHDIWLAISTYGALGPAVERAYEEASR